MLDWLNKLKGTVCKKLVNGTGLHSPKASLKKSCSTEKDNNLNNLSSTVKNLELKVNLDFCKMLIRSIKCLKSVSSILVISVALRRHSQIQIKLNRNKAKIQNLDCFHFLPSTSSICQTSFNVYKFLKWIRGGLVGLSAC